MFSYQQGQGPGTGQGQMQQYNKNPLSFSKPPSLMSGALSNYAQTPDKKGSLSPNVSEPSANSPSTPQYSFGAGGNNGGSSGGGITNNYEGAQGSNVNITPSYTYNTNSEATYNNSSQNANTYNITTNAEAPDFSGMTDTVSQIYALLQQDSQAEADWRQQQMAFVGTGGGVTGGVSPVPTVPMGPNGPLNNVYVPQMSGGTPTQLRWG